MTGIATFKLLNGDKMRDITEIKEYESTNSLPKSANGEVLPYKVGHSYIYPCVQISSKTNKFQKYKLDVLKGMIKNVVGGYMTYLCTEKGNVKLGYIDRNSLKVLKDSDVFSDYDLKVYLTKDDIIEGDMIYALL